MSKPAETSTPEERPQFGRGEGSIDELPSGQFRVRVPDGFGGRKTLRGTSDSWEEANKRRLAAIALIASGTVKPTNQITVSDMAQKLLALKAAHRPRSHTKLETRWRIHIAPEDFAAWPIADLTREVVGAFVVKLKRREVVRFGKTKVMAPVYQRQVFELLDEVCRFAVAEGVIARNPCEGQILPKLPKRNSDDDDDTWADLAAQERAFNSPEIAEFDRLTMAFAAATGLREMEQMLLPRKALAQLVKTGRLKVEFGGFDADGNPTIPKNERRTVIVVDWGIPVAARILELLPTYCPKNPLDLAFPNPTSGGYRKNGHPLNRHGNSGCHWRDARKAADLPESFTWHSWRRTCASSLFSGLYGRKWTIEEVAKYIGDTVEVTARYYARMHSTTMEEAARETKGGPAIGSRNGSRPEPSIPQIARENPGEAGSDREACIPCLPTPAEQLLDPDPSLRDLKRDLLETALAVLHEIARGEFSDRDCDAFARTVETSLPQLLSTVGALQRLKQRGPHRVRRARELAVDLRKLLTPVVATKKGGAL